MEITPEEAIEQYWLAVEATGSKRTDYPCRNEGKWICIGVANSQLPSGVQWGMQWHTPEEVVKMAKMRVLLHQSPEFDIRIR